MKRTAFLIALIFCLNAWGTFAQTIDPDSIELVKKQLTRVKKSLIENLVKKSSNSSQIIQSMLELGMWQEASNAISGLKSESIEHQLLAAEYLILTNEFKEAELIVNKILVNNGQEEKAILLKSVLEMHAWRLPEAGSILEKALKNVRSEKLQLMLGRIRLLEKKYSEALTIAQNVLKVNKQSAGAYLLEADTYFWDQQPELALAP